MINIGAIAASINKINPNADPYWADVILLLPFESNFVDASGRHSVTITGSPTITPTGNPATYGTNCASFGSGNRITFPDSPDWNFGQNVDLTLEFWMRPETSDLSGIHAVMLQRSGLGLEFGLYNGKIFIWADNATMYNAGMTFSAGVSYYVKITREYVAGVNVNQDSLWRIVINGTQDASFLNNWTLPDNAADVAIGGDNYGAGQHFYGKLKDLRITRHARNTDTVPTAAHPTE